MSTKNSPGAYDCYANAEPDEEMFVLLSRDESAPEVVEFWAQKYLERKAVEAQEAGRGEYAPGVIDKYEEAIAVAARMREQQQ